MNTDLIVQLLLAAIGATLAVIAVQLFRTKQREDDASHQQPPRPFLITQTR